jgi:hypothetical protein
VNFTYWKISPQGKNIANVIEGGKYEKGNIKKWESLKEQESKRKDF